MKEIPLGNGGVTLVDDVDFEWANQWRWFWRKHRGKVYAERSERRGGRTAPKRYITMHRALMKAQPGQQVDHKNGGRAGQPAIGEPALVR